MNACADSSLMQRLRTVPFWAMCADELDEAVP